MNARRIVLGLEAGMSARELEASAQLAQRVDAELLGLFVEDADLLRFAELPFALEIGLASAQRRRPDAAALQREMRELAAEAERALAGIAARVPVRWSFRVARGHAATELLAAAAEAAREDLRLLLLGDGDSPVTRWAEAACARRAGAGAAPRLELVLAADVDELAAALKAAAPGVVVLRAEASLLEQRGLPDLLQSSAASVLVLPARLTLPRAASARASRAGR